MEGGGADVTLSFWSHTNIKDEGDEDVGEFGGGSCSF